MLQGVEQLLKKFDRFSDQALKGVQQETFLGALKVETEAKKRIQRGPKTGRIYRRGNTTHQASAPGESPASDKGRLASSINTQEVSGSRKLAFEVQTSLKYSTSLEFGTSKMAPRPFMLPALETHKKDIVRDIGRAIQTATKKVQKK